MIEINSVYGIGRFYSTASVQSEAESKPGCTNMIDGCSEQSANDSLSLTIDSRYGGAWNNSPPSCATGSAFSNEVFGGQKGALAGFFVPRNLSEQEAESLSNQQLKAEYSRHRQISSDSTTKQEQCVGQSVALNQTKEQAIHMNKLSATLKQSGQKLGQQALLQIASGLALYASGVAMEAAGKAMLACPFTKAAGAALISKGKALKQRGLRMQQNGQKLGVSSKTLLSSGLNLGNLATKKLNNVKQTWQILNKVYQQVKNIGELAKNSMLCVESVGRKRGLNISDAAGANKQVATVFSMAFGQSNTNIAKKSQLGTGFQPAADNASLAFNNDSL